MGMGANFMDGLAAARKCVEEAIEYMEQFDWRNQGREDPTPHLMRIQIPASNGSNACMLGRKFTKDVLQLFRCPCESGLRYL